MKLAAIILSAISVLMILVKIYMSKKYPRNRNWFGMDEEE